MEKKEIFVTHITVRQSIFFLLLKLIFIDIFAALVVIIFFSSLLIPFLPNELKLRIIAFSNIYFLILVVLKISVTIFIVLQWLNEYYEITPLSITHKEGLIWRKEESYSLQSIKSVGIKQGIFGRAFNFGTLNLYDWTLEKNIFIYLIHNPMKYLHVLESLLPKSNEEKDIVREHIGEPENEEL